MKVLQGFRDNKKVKKHCNRPLCLICNQTVNVNKDYNIKQHYDSKHADDVYGKLKGRDGKVKVKELKEQLKSQRFMFQKVHTDNKKKQFDAVS